MLSELLAPLLIAAQLEERQAVTWKAGRAVAFGGVEFWSTKRARSTMGKAPANQKDAERATGMGAEGGEDGDDLGPGNGTCE